MKLTISDSEHTSVCIMALKEMEEEEIEDRKGKDEN
jgi:hypothetical protein